MELPVTPLHQHATSAISNLYRTPQILRSVAARHGSIRENRAMEVDTMLMRSDPFGETISA